MRWRPATIVCWLWIASSVPAIADESKARATLTAELRELSPRVLSADQRDALAAMVREDQSRRLKAANERSTAEWRKIADRESWERFRAERLDALRQSLGSLRRAGFQPADPTLPRNTRITGTWDGDGYRVENVVFESRPGMWVTANLYLPAKPTESMPGIIASHSHHRPKEQGELQDMGATWSRHGCVVLVPDHLGHGERRQHPFQSESDYAGPFAVGRQDYYFRYDTGMQLQLAGESLMGWMAWDLMRGVDLLLSRPGIDPKRIILLGSVAGGGDPAAVTAALDERIAAAVPFNFGGPQPETRYPLPDDAETAFNYAGSGSWESTRNLAGSAVGWAFSFPDEGCGSIRAGSKTALLFESAGWKPALRVGFLPWVIVGGIAPRRLVYAHEFAWDRDRDPVWKRLQAIYGFYDADENLTAAHGGGRLSGQPPAATHCTNIGAVHRRMIHPAFQQWFGISVTPDDEYSARRDASALLAMTPQAERDLRPKRLVDLLPQLARERTDAVRKQLAGKDAAEQRLLLRAAWACLLGRVEPPKAPTARQRDRKSRELSGAAVERIVLEVEPGILVPLLLLVPQREGDQRTNVEQQPSVVVAVAQSGKEGFVRNRADDVARLLAGGTAVCLPDLRGTGESRSGDNRGQTGADTARSATELMLGGTMLGARLRDLRSVLQYLRSRDDLDSKRVALWGDSFAPVNANDANLQRPHRVDHRPHQSEPLGGLLALLGGLFDDDVNAVYVAGGLSDVHSVLTSQFVLIPHDAVVPAAVAAGDLCDIAAAFTPRPLCLEGLVDGLNRRLSAEAVRGVFQPALQSYRRAGAEQHISISEAARSPAAWLLRK